MLYKIHTMTKTRHVVFHKSAVRFIDENLSDVRIVPWKNQLPDIDPILSMHSITANHKDWEDKGFVITFKIDP